MNIGGYEFDITMFVNYLNEFKGNLYELYSWDTPKDKDIFKLFNMKIINTEELNLLLKNSRFRRNIILKRILANALNTTTDKEKLNLICKWIIRDWGGIAGFKDNNPYERVEKFKNEVECFSVNEEAIASVSKVLSFIDTQKYAIFDSRVAYSLNWIILKCNAADSFFSIPEGRNSKMNAFNMNTLIHINKIDMFKINDIKDVDRLFISNRDKNIYIPNRKTYPVFIELIQAINSQLWIGDKERQKYPYYTEMLLFSIADTYVIKDIIETYSK